ncbi:MAG: hypothetical protein V1723_00910 [Candidatus Uhrbacteria bacterium]
MFLTVHGTSGALIGAFTGEPISAFAIGLLSHGILDAIPHGDSGLFRRPDGTTNVSALVRVATMDAAVLLFVLTLATVVRGVAPNAAIIAGVSGAILPDFVNGLAVLYPRSHFLGVCSQVHKFIHTRFAQRDFSRATGFALQGTAVIIFVVTYALL